MVIYNHVLAVMQLYDMKKMSVYKGLQKMLK